VILVKSKKQLGIYAIIICTIILIISIVVPTSLEYIEKSRFVGLWKYEWLDLDNETQKTYLDFYLDGTYNWFANLKWEINDNILFMPAQGVGNNKFYYSFSNNDNILTLVSVENNDSRVFSRVIYENEATDSISIDENQYRNASKDPIDIKKYYIEGDILRLCVQYGGGCEEHEFMLIGSGAWNTTNPLAIHVRISHNAHDDMCMVLIGDTLFYDLSPLKEALMDTYQQDSGSIYIILEGLNEPILYEF